MGADTIYQIVSVVVIPIIVTLLKKVNLPNKWAPVTAFGIAIVLAVVGQLLGITVDVNTVAQTIMASLATAGVAVLGYDQIKKLTETK